jgi:hypothetical protein
VLQQLKDSLGDSGGGGENATPTSCSSASWYYDNNNNNNNNSIIDTRMVKPIMLSAAIIGFILVHFM